jgi:hypothetical protein
MARKLARAVSMRIASMGAYGARSRVRCCARMMSFLKSDENALPAVFGNRRVVECKALRLLKEIV